MHMFSPQLDDLVFGHLHIRRENPTGHRGDPRRIPILSLSHIKIFMKDIQYMDRTIRNCTPVFNTQSYERKSFYIN